MSDSILVTKLFIPPTQSEFVSRPRLLERLNAGLVRKLTLVSAPAGFGKTSLASEWVDRLRSDSTIGSATDHKIAWISLDKDDNDPTRFLTDLIAALKRAEGIGNDLADSLMSMLHSPQTLPIRDIVTAIINERAGLADKLIVVLDDYHLIEESPVHETLSFLVEYLPPQIHVVILTREDPHLIAQGLSRQEIATQLVLSLNTVKTHVRNIYSKLGVNNQMQAVGKARVLGLLENV